MDIPSKVYKKKYEIIFRNSNSGKTMVVREKTLRICKSPVDLCRGRYGRGRGAIGTLILKIMTVL